MPCVYVLFSETTQKFSVGSSHEDIPEFRLNAHNSGKTRSTKAGRPWTLVYQEHFPEYREARKRELFLKSGQGRKFIKERCPSGLRSES